MGPAPSNKSRLVLLPRPAVGGSMSLPDVLALRRSCRDFVDKDLSSDQIAQLCWAGQGITNDRHGWRTAPSAGAWYPATLFVATAEGVFEYLPAEHGLAPVLDKDVRGSLQQAGAGQPCLAEAPLCMAIVVDVGQMVSRYHADAERYCLIEVGHVAQNVLLQATAMGLGGVAIGAFDRDLAYSALRLPGHMQPVYLLPIGYPGRS